MILDQQGILSGTESGGVWTGQGPITASAASTNMIDMQSIGANAPDVLGSNMGSGKRLRVLFTCTQTFNNLTSLAISLQTAPDSGAPLMNRSNASAGTFADAVALTIPLASLTAGAQWTLTLPDFSTGPWLQAYYTVNGTAPSTGEMTAVIVEDVQTNRYTPKTTEWPV